MCKKTTQTAHEVLTQIVAVIPKSHPASVPKKKDTTLTYEVTQLFWMLHLILIALSPKRLSQEDAVLYDELP